jgi:dephospho-CoA kinase
MGKSTTSSLLRRLGGAVHDADATVHRLMGKGGIAVPEIEAAFPGVIAEGAVNRARLGERVFGNPVALRRLEAILHPLVALDRDRFLANSIQKRHSFAVLDVPLLFETGGEKYCDEVILVTAPALIQEQRVLARPGMTAQKLGDIRARQMPEAEKRYLADHIIWTSLGRASVFQRLQQLLFRC